MGKLLVGTYLTIDGVYQAPGAPDEDREGGFEHGGWSGGYWDDEMGTHILEVVTSSDALLLGRKTYDIFAGYWPAATNPVGVHLNSVPKYVVSRRAVTADWANTTVLDGDIPEAVAKLKEQHELVSVTGSGDLIQTLLRHDLVDLFTFWVFPVILGSGKRLFDHGAIPVGLRVVDSWTSATGVTITNYERAGDIRYAEVA